MTRRLLTHALGTIAVLVAGVVFGVVLVRSVVDALRSEPPIVEPIELTPASTSVPVESAPILPTPPGDDDVNSEPQSAPPASSPTPEPPPERPAPASLTPTPSTPLHGSAPPPAPVGMDDDDDVDDVDDDGDRSIPDGDDD